MLGAHLISGKRTRLFLRVALLGAVLATAATTTLPPEAPGAGAGICHCCGRPGCGCKCSEKPAQKCDQAALDKAKADFERWFGVYKDQSGNADALSEMAMKSAEEADKLFDEKFGLEGLQELHDEASYHVIGEEVAKAGGEHFAEMVGHHMAVVAIVEFLRDMGVLEYKTITLTKEMDRSASEGGKASDAAYESLQKARAAHEQMDKLAKQCKAKDSSGGQSDKDSESEDSWKSSAQKEAEAARKILDSWKKVEGGYQNAKGDFYDAESARREALEIVQSQDESMGSQTLVLVSVQTSEGVRFAFPRAISDGKKLGPQKLKRFIKVMGRGFERLAKGVRTCDRVRVELQKLGQLRSSRGASPLPAHVKPTLPQLFSLSCDPTTVSAHGSTSCTVSLDAPVPRTPDKLGEGAVVSLSWPSGSREIRIPAGHARAAVSIPLHNDSTAGKQEVPIQAQYGTVTKSVTVTVSAAVFQSLTVAPAQVTSGGQATVTVTLKTPAPQGGLKVKLASDHAAAVPVPGSISVPAGLVSADFQISPKGVASQTLVTITATSDYQSTHDHVSGTLYVSPLDVLHRLKIDQSVIRGGLGNQGVVTLTAPAPQGGLKVTLSGDAPTVATLPPLPPPAAVVIIPDHVTVPAGQFEASFPIATKPVNAYTQVTIRASTGYEGADTASSSFALTPPDFDRLGWVSGYTPDMNVPLGGVSVKLFALLGEPAAPDTFVQLTYTSTELINGPSKVEIPAGGTRGEFTVTLLPCPSTTCDVDVEGKFYLHHKSLLLQYRNPAAQESTSSQVGQAGASPGVKWTTQPNAALKGSMGRLMVNFQKEVEHRFSGVAIFPPSGTTATKNWYGNTDHQLSPGHYDVAVSGARVAQVPIIQGTDTRLLVGALRIQTDGKTRVEVWDAGRTKLFQWTFANNAVIGLPIGPYAVKISKGAGTFTDIMIEDGKITDFRAP